MKPRLFDGDTLKGVYLVGVCGVEKTADLSGGDHFFVGTAVRAGTRRLTYGRLIQLSGFLLERHLA
jgi:hypothetical protein